MLSGGESVDFHTPYRSHPTSRTGGDAERIVGTLPVPKLDSLNSYGIVEFDVSGVKKDTILAILKGDEGGDLEWYDDKLVRRIEGKPRSRFARG